MFFPCGYSLNGANDRTYYTIHVTPQPSCSYASFETNCRYSDYDEILGKIVKIFKPGRFIMNITSQSAQPSVRVYSHGFRRRDWVQYNFGRYVLSMGHFVQVAKYARTKSTLDLLAEEEEVEGAL